MWLHVQGSVKEMMNLSQQDYVKRIEELNQALITAWEQDQRVKSLKIAIQVLFFPSVYSEIGWFVCLSAVLAFCFYCLLLLLLLLLQFLLLLFFFFFSPSLE